AGRRHGPGDAGPDAGRSGELRRLHAGPRQGVHGLDERDSGLHRRRRDADGHLVNGAFSLPQPLQGLGVVKTWTAPTSNEVVPVTFKQAIGASDALRTGSYSKTLTFTLSTTNP